MIPATLKEYRCSCGKLLFKGLLGTSIVEIKCKRCNNISSFGDMKSDKIQIPFMIAVDKKV
jgi:phage FluMu protein Com